MATLALLKFLKFLGLFGFVGMCFLLPSKPIEQRMISFLGGVTFSFLLLWGSGYLMMKYMGHSLREPWIALSIMANLLSFGALFHLSTHKSCVKAKAALHLTVVLTIGFMCFRPDSFSVSVGSIMACLVGAYIVLAKGWNLSGQNNQQVRAIMLKIAMLEGASLILLMLISMPLRKVFSISLDQGTGLIGWIHGALVLVYILVLFQSLVYRVINRKQLILGIVASMIPFGFVWYERRIRS